MANFNVKIDGLGDVLKMFDQVGGEQAQADVDKITEAYTRKMASESAEMAPVDTGALKNSLASSPRQAPEPHTWQWGSDKEYATRQEYEHKTKKAFVRKAIWTNENDYVDAVKRRITKG